MPQIRQAPDFSPATGLTPVATPVDTFASNPATNPMFQLADALSSLNPALQNYGSVSMKALDDKDFAEGKLAYLKAKSNLKDAVNKGVIQPGYSPAFQRGYQQGQLRNLGLDYDQKLRTAYSTSNAANSPDPNAYAGFVSDFTNQYIKDNNIAGGFHPVDVAQAFEPTMDAAQRSLSEYHVQQQAKTVEDNWEINTQNEISTTIDNAHANNFTTEQTGAAVNSVIDKSMANGWHDKTQFNRNVVELVTNKAIGSNNTGILSILDHIPTGPGGTLGNTTFARSKVLEAQQKIEDQGRADTRWQWAQQEHTYSTQQQAWAQQEHAHTQQDWGIEQSAGTLMRSMISQAILDPSQDFTKQTLQLTNMDRNGDHARTFMAFKNSILDAKENGSDNPHAVTGLYQDMLNRPQTFDPSRIVDAYNSNLISKKTMTGMMDDQRHIAEVGASPLLRDPVYTTMKEGITKAFQGDPNQFDVTKVTKTTDALMAFQRHALEFISKNKTNLDSSSFYDEMSKYSKHLTQPLLDAEKPAAKPKPGAAAPANPYLAPNMGH